MSSKLKKLIPGVAFFFPFVLFAQSSGGSGDTLKTLGKQIVGILQDTVIPIIMALAVVYFLIGVFKYIMAAGDDAAKSAGRSMMIYGVIALFVMTAVWGLVWILLNTFGVAGIQPPPLPVLP